MLITTIKNNLMGRLHSKTSNREEKTLEQPKQKNHKKSILTALSALAAVGIASVALANKKEVQSTNNNPLAQQSNDAPKGYLYGGVTAPVEQQNITKPQDTPEQIETEKPEVEVKEEPKQKPTLKFNNAMAYINGKPYTGSITIPQKNSTNYYKVYYNHGNLAGSRLYTPSTDNTEDKIIETKGYFTLGDKKIIKILDENNVLKEALVSKDNKIVHQKDDIMTITTKQQDGSWKVTKKEVKQ
jgi:hypothetical protein